MQMHSLFFVPVVYFEHTCMQVQKYLPVFELISCWKFMTPSPDATSGPRGSCEAYCA